MVGVASLRKGCVWYKHSQVPELKFHFKNKMAVQPFATTQCLRSIFITTDKTSIFFVNEMNYFHWNFIRREKPKD